MQISEEDILERIAKDDKSAFEFIFRSYYKDLTRFSLKYVKDEHVAEEVVQEVFINIWDRRSVLQINTSVKAYLFAAVRNRSLNYIKLQIPKDQKKVNVDQLFDLGDKSENREQELEFDDLRTYVQHAIQSLPPKCQIIFNLSRNSGMTYKEIAEELDLSVKTVENQVGLALKKLRLYLNPVWDKIVVLIITFFL